MLALVKDAGEHGVNLLGDGFCDCFSFFTDDQGEGERDLNLLLAINFVTIELSSKLLDDGVGLWSHLDQEKKVLDDNLSDDIVGLNITKSFEERRLELSNHCSHHSGSFDEHQSKRQEDLELEIWGELVIDHTNKCTTNLDDFGLDRRWAGKINKILEAICAINSNSDRSMHN